MKLLILVTLLCAGCANDTFRRNVEEVDFKGGFYEDSVSVRARVFFRDPDAHSYAK